MIIRQLQQSDKEKWISFFQGLSSETIEKRYYHSVKNYDFDIIKQYWNDIIKYPISLIAEVNNEIVGCVELYINKHPDNHGEIAIVITDKYQGIGIGYKLIVAIESIAKEQKLTSTWFITQSKYMKKLGKKYGYIKTKYGWEKELK